MTERDRDGPNDASSRLDASVQRVLRDLPSRRAPASLEARVLGELQRRAGAPWWHRGFAHWSWVTRAGFAAACLALMALSVWGAVWPTEFGLPGSVSAQAISDLSLQLPALQPAVALLASAQGLAELLARLIPTTWVQWGLGFGVLLYMILFGLGAAGYRALFLQPGNSR